MTFHPPAPPRHPPRDTPPTEPVWSPPAAVDAVDARSGGEPVVTSGRDVSRVAAIDAARAIAFVGMLLSHFARSTRSTDPGWLQAVDNVADGRAAPLFCVLLGVGAGLLARGSHPDRRLLVRGTVLFAASVAVWPYVEGVYFILPQYGLLLAAMPLLRRLADRWLLPLALVPFSVLSVVAARQEVGRPLRTGRQPHEYEDLREVGRLLRFLVWDGGYPLVGWVGFALVGLWLSHRDLRRATTRWAILGAGMALAAAQPLLVVVERRLLPTSGDAGLAAFLGTASHSNLLGWYLVAAGTAVAVIAALAVVDHGVGLPAPVVHLGQLALSVYAAHLVIGTEWLWPWRDRVEPSLARQTMVVLLIAAGLTVAATLWRRRFSRGPLEAVLRAVAR